MEQMLSIADYRRVAASVKRRLPLPKVWDLTLERCVAKRRQCRASAGMNVVQQSSRGENASQTPLHVQAGVYMRAGNRVLRGEHELQKPEGQTRRPPRHYGPSALSLCLRV
jgi:hypothetical protein